MFISRNPPVPKVIFTSPRSKQVWPNSAACWSPRAEAIGTDTPMTEGSVVPNTCPGGHGVGSMASGIPRISKSSESHARSVMLNIIVRAALE